MQLTILIKKLYIFIIKSFINKNSMSIIFTLRKQLFYYHWLKFFSLCFCLIIINNSKQYITQNNNIYDFYKLLYNLMLQDKIFVNIMIYIYMKLF